MSGARRGIGRAVAGLGLALLPAVAGAAAARPNIVFILADDLGYGEVSFLGQQRYATPNIDRIAREGLVFTDGYAGSPICAPSRNTLMTGHHTGHATVRNNFAGGGSGGDRVALGPRDVTIAERLRQAGYATALVGKWGLGEPETPAAPWRKGWDFFYGFVNQAHAHNQYPEFLYRNATPEPLPGNFSHQEGVYANDRFTEEALAWMAGPVAAKRPFFLYLSYTTPHADLRCPPDSIAELREQQPWARAADAPEPALHFAGMMLRLDRDVGRVLARLAELGIDRDTLVIFTADNGAHQEDRKDNAFFAASGPFRGIKRDLYEGGIRVPFCARWPGRIAAGTRTAQPVAFWDFPATALELAGAGRPADLPAESISFVPTLLGAAGREPTPRPLYWEILIKGQARQAIREGNWKLVRYGLDRAPELYDLAADPGEKHNRATAQPERLARMTELLATLRTESADFPLSPAAGSGGKTKVKK